MQLFQTFVNADVRANARKKGHAAKFFEQRHVLTCQISNFEIKIMGKLKPKIVSEI